MRKVIYQHWEKKTGDGPTYGWSELESGYFHSWGMQEVEGIMSTVGVVENITSGCIHLPLPEKIRFVQPPETRTHKNDVADMEVIKKDIGYVIEKLDDLAPKTEHIQALSKVLKNIKDRL